MDNRIVACHPYRMELDNETDGPPNTSTLRITDEMLKLIAELDEFKGAWRAIGRLAPDRLAGLRRVATIESVGSSTRIEGAKLTNREVEALLAGIDIQSFQSRDEQEVAGYADAMETVFASHVAIDLSENHIKQLHRDLLKFSDKDERHRGAYKTLSNNVEAIGPNGEHLGIVFETASPFDTPRRMTQLIAWTNTSIEAERHHPLLVIAVFIVVFLEIHPFQDGNGRLSRILTTLLLLRAGYAYVPYSSMETIVEETKDGYYRALRRTQGTIRMDAPDWQPWTMYFLRALCEQKRRLARKVERERSILGELPELSATILELARERGRVTVAEAASVTNKSRNTIKDHIKVLVTEGHLSRHGAGRGTWYGLG